MRTTVLHQKLLVYKLENLNNPSESQQCEINRRSYKDLQNLVVKGETSLSHEIDEKGFHGELCSSDRSGQPDNLSENIRVEQIHDRSGQLDERNSSSAHTVKEQHAPEVHREIASFIQHEQRVQSCNQRGGH